MILLKNITYIDFETFDFKKGNLLIHSGKDKDIEFTDKIPSEAEIYDTEGKFAMQNFVVGHHHIYSGLVTLVPGIKRPPLNFFEILNKIWWRVDKALDTDIIKASAYAVGIQAIKNGVGYIIDHHSSPMAIKGSLKTIASVLEELGLNYLLCYEISDRDGELIREEALQETADYLKDNQGLIGLHAPFTLEDETLMKSAELLETYNTGIHIHVAEDRLDTDLSLVNYGKTVLERLDYYGLLNTSKTILAHGIHFTDYDFNIFNNSKVFLVQNPDSNLNNNVGFLQTNKIDKTRLMLGTDGMHSDMIKSAQTAYFAGKKYGNPSMDDVFNQLRNNWKYLKINKFQGTGKNNIVIFDYIPFARFDKETFLSHFFFKFDASIISDLIVNGKFVMKNRKILTIDTKTISQFTTEQSKRLIFTLNEI